MNKLIRGIGAVLGLALGLASSEALALTASLLQNGEQTFVDQNGQPYAGGSVYFYIPATTTPKNTWKDPTQSALNTNPVVLDAAGRAIIYGNGAYRQVVKDVFGNTVWDQLTADVVNAAGISSAMAPVVSASSTAAALTALGLGFGQNVILDASSNLAAGHLSNLLAADTTLTIANNGNQLYLYGGTSHTITFPAALPAQFSVWIYNNDSVAWTISQPGGGFIEGQRAFNAATMSLNTGEGGLFVASGNGFLTFLGGATIPITSVSAGAAQAYTNAHNGFTWFRSNAGAAMADTLVQPGATRVTAGYRLTVANQDTTGNLTLTPAGSTINGAATLVLRPGQTANIETNGTNYFAHVENKTGTLTAGAVLTMNPLVYNSAVTQAHGLGAEPTMFKIVLQNLIAEGNYAPGDRLVMEPSPYNTGNNGFAVQVDATNVVLRMSGGIQIPNKTTFVTFVATAADWELFITPYILN